MSIRQLIGSDESTGTYRAGYGLYVGIAATVFLGVLSLSMIEARKETYKAELSALSSSPNPVALHCALNGIHQHNMVFCIEALRTQREPAPLKPTIASAY